MSLMEKSFPASREMETKAESNENIKTTDQFAKQFIELESLNDEIYSRIEELKEEIKEIRKERGKISNELGELKNKNCRRGLELMREDEEMGKEISKREREMYNKLPMEISERVRVFFEEKSETITAIELSNGGNYDRDAIKIFPNGQALLKQVEAHYDSDDTRYDLCDSEEAKGLLQESINDDNQKIKELTERKNAVEKALEKLL